MTLGLDLANQLKRRIDIRQVFASQNIKWEAPPISYNSFNTGLHESFHQKQDGFLPRGISGSRHNSVPFAKDFILGRAMALHRFYLHLNESNNNDKNFCLAVNWLRSAKKLDPESSAQFRQTDILEGSAEYFSNRATAIAFSLKGCAAQKEEIVRAMQFGLDMKRIPIEPDSQSYPLGTFAGLALDDLKIPDWHNRVERGESPSEILIKESKCPDTSNLEPDPSLKSEVEKSELALNSSWSNLEKQLDAPETVRVSISQHERQGSFSTSGFLQNRPRVYRSLKI